MIIAATLMSCNGSGPKIEEINGYVIFEAEDFISQEKSDVRSWVIQTEDNACSDTSQPDPDPLHCTTASNKSYIEILPDTRVTHDDPLVKGVSFSNEPGILAVISYDIKFNTPGKYYVWARVFSTGAEDNGMHVGIDGTWPESGQRMQWCDGKNQWTWESKQRTKEVHCGVEKQIYLMVDEPGVHKISFSMREDGFELDQIVLSQKYEKPE